MFKFRLLICFALLAALCALLPSCSSNGDIRISKNPEMTDYAPPIELQRDSTVIELSDYFRHPRNIDSIFVHKGIAWSVSGDSLRLTLVIQDKSIPRLSVMKVYADGYPYSILLKKSEKLWYHINFDPRGVQYKKVEITGEMNGWTGSKALSYKDGKWFTDLNLYPGKYEYQLIIDGKMMIDPSNPDRTEGLYGGWNSWFRAGSTFNPGAPVLFTYKAQKDQVSVGIRNKTTDIFVFWQNHLLDSTFWKTDSIGISIRIPKKAKDFDRSFVHVLAFNGAGISNEILVPVSDGKVLTDPSDITREDQQAMIIYSLMTDRFSDGNPGNDLPVRDSLLDKRLNFQGGDFSGILSKIEDNYFGKLGVNTIWVTPVTAAPQSAWPDFTQNYRKSAGYHGYWPVSVSTVDKRLGTSDELKSLVEEAHSKDINVILDFVSNRLHKESLLYQQHPDWFTPQLLENKKKNVRLWKEQPYTTWFDDFLPTLDLTNPDVSAMMADSAIFWIKAYEIDGFRHDAVNHVMDSYWRMLNRKLKENVIIPDKRPVFQIGEDFGTREENAKFISPGIMDAVFDFNLYLTAARVFARDNASFRELNYAARESMNMFGDHSLMGNVSGVNDLPRFISYASNSITSGEDYIKAGWDRNIQVTDSVAYKKLALLHAFNMTIPGIPVIYYGDEIGMAGAGEPDNRRMMRFDSLNDHELKLKETVEKLTKLRKNSLPLIYGDMVPLDVTDKIFVYMRSYFGKVIFVIFNKNYTSAEITFEIPERFSGIRLVNHFGSNAVLKKNKVTLTLKGNSFEILGN